MNTNHAIGDMLHLEGYDLTAKAGCDYGEVLVLNNNSTHLLVVEVDFDQARPDGSLTGTGRLVASFRYGQNGLNPRAAYAAALQAASAHALERCSSLDECDAELPQAARKMWS